MPDELWQRIQPLLPLPASRPRGGVPDRNCVAALVFMTRTSTPWALLPAKELGCGSATTCWRRFDEWAKVGVFDKLQALLLDELVRPDASTTTMMWAASWATATSPSRSTGKHVGQQGPPAPLLELLGGDGAGGASRRGSTRRGGRLKPFASHRRS